ncbi:hypothetical protein DICVIV_08706 [Dictyocaulus viviparus]|uniref:HEAT repeat-containing protein 1 n=1 Tax=Dictyocaulus viviparus TaxID=29172 RepID=A0A0D8XNE7_DICVI|nr:hypothetical protein DICVIV_08706 [Dictyocaulus viviparus]
MKTTMASAIPLLKTCLSILEEFSSNQKDNEEFINLLEVEPSKQQRLRQQSLSGKKLGSSMMLVGVLLVHSFYSKSYFHLMVHLFLNIEGVCLNLHAAHHRPVCFICFKIFVRHHHSNMLFDWAKALLALFVLLKSYFNPKNQVTVTQIRETLMTDVFLNGLEYRAPSTILSTLCHYHILESWLVLLIRSYEHAMPLLSMMEGNQWSSQNLILSRTLLISLLIAPVIENFSPSMSVFNYFFFDFPNVGAVIRDRARMLVEPLVNEVMNVNSSGHKERCVNHLSNALYNIADIHPDNFQDILDKILLMTRNKKAKVRHRSLLVIGAMFDKVGDSVAPYLPMIMPFLSELLEGILIIRL